MNKNQIKGSAKEIAGKVQAETGKLVGSEEQQAKGTARQVAGNVEKNFGNAKEAVKDAVDKVKKHH